LSAAECDEALRLFESGAYDAAVQHTAACLSLDGDSVPARKLMGRLLLRKGEVAEARSHWEQAKALAPDDADVRDLLSGLATTERRRKLLWAVGVAGCLLVIVSSGFLLFFQPLHFLSSQLGQVKGKLEDLQLYQRTHTKSDSNVERVATELSNTKASESDLRQRFEEYRMTHRLSDKNLETFSQTISNLSAHVAGTRNDYTNLLAEHRAVNSRFDDLARNYTNVVLDLKELVPASVAARTADLASSAQLDQAQTQITQLQQQLKRLLNEHTALTNQLVEAIKSTTRWADTLKSDIQNGIQPRLTPSIPLSSPPTVNLCVPGITVTTQMQSLVVFFDSGLFQRGTLLRSGAKDCLIAIGKQLEAFSAHISVEIVGHTDESPTFSDDIMIGQKRALIVAELFRIKCQVPARILTTRSLGLADLPFSNDTPQNRARNRTVVLRISSAAR
jgi:flagellar motor protein MotB